MQLQRSCSGKRLIARTRGIFLAAERIENAGFSQQVLESFFVLDGLIFVLQRLLEVCVIVEQVVRGIIPSVPRVLSQTSELFVEILRDSHLRVHADCKW